MEAPRRHALERERHGEAGPTAGLGLGRNLAVHHLGEQAADGQPQARAAETAGDRSVGLFEAAEQARARLGVETDARVIDAEFQAGLQRVDRQLHPARGGELDRIGQEVRQHLGDPDRIAAIGAAGVFGDRPDQLQPLGRGRGPVQLRDPGHQALQVEVTGLQTHLARLDL